MPRDAEVKQLEAERDALQKQYNEIFKKPGLTETQRIAAARKALEKSIADYEDRLKRKDVGPRRFLRPRIETPELKALRARRDSLQEELGVLRDAMNPKASPEERSQRAYKASLRRRVAEYEARLKRGDFAPKPKKQRKLDAETETLRFALEKAKADWLKGLAAARRARRSTAEKVFSLTPEALNTSRAILTSVDFSAVLRQGGITAASHPILSFKAMGDMFRSFASEAGFSRAENALTNRKNAQLYRQAKLALTSIHGRLSAQEEAYMSEWAKRIPLVAGSERAYVAFLNRVRADMFDAMAASVGKNGGVTAAEARLIANYVNVVTGRGDLGKVQGVAVPLATVFFSPRFVASRFQFLTLQPLRRGLIKPETRGSAKVRLAIAKEYARTLIGVGLFYSTMKMALHALLGEPGKDKKWDIVFDPRSSDFLKIRIGKTRIDPLFGLQQVTVLGSRLTTGETTNLRGRTVPIRGPKVPFGGTTSSDVMTNFLRSKLSPILGVAWDTIKGENFRDEPMTPGAAAKGLVVPISFQDIADLMKEQGLTAGTALQLVNLFGVSVQTHTPRSLGEGPERTKRIAGIASLIGSETEEKPDENRAAYRARQATHGEDIKDAIARLRDAGVTPEEAIAALKADYRRRGMTLSGERESRIRKAFRQEARP